MLTNDSPVKAILVVLLVALVTSSLVAATVVLLRPIQLNNQLLDRSRNILQLTGLIPAGAARSDEEVLALFKSLDARIVDIDAAKFDTTIEPYGFDRRGAARDPQVSVTIPSGFDRAGLGRRSVFAPVYLVWKDNEFQRIILPVHGKGMWSTLYGYIALEPDLNTIAEATFYQQNETPGMGDQITRSGWLAQWRGRRIYDERGEIHFAVAVGKVDPGSLSAAFEVDALTGATVTTDAVTELIHYWFGPHGYQPFLANLRAQRPAKPMPTEDP
jgi:Na+-transporting NADH:ubiquinone oxidoreductase subunit C